MSDVVPVHVDVITETLAQGGAIIVALVTAVASVIAAWRHGRYSGEKRASSANTNGLHSHLTEGFKLQMEEAKQHYESLLREYRELHDERSRRIDELTAEIHALRAEVHHLHDVLAQHGIPIPPRLIHTSRME